MYFSGDHFCSTCVFSLWEVFSTGGVVLCGVILIFNFDFACYILIFAGVQRFQFDVRFHVGLQAPFFECAREVCTYSQGDDRFPVNKNTDSAFG